MVEVETLPLVHGDTCFVYQPIKLGVVVVRKQASRTEKRTIDTISVRSRVSPSEEEHRSGLVEICEVVYERHEVVGSNRCLDAGLRKLTSYGFRYFLVADVTALGTVERDFEAIRKAGFGEQALGTRQVPLWRDEGSIEPEVQAGEQCGDPLRLAVEHPGDELVRVDRRDDRLTHPLIRCWTRVNTNQAMLGVELMRVEDQLNRPYAGRGSQEESRVTRNGAREVRRDIHTEVNLAVLECRDPDGIIGNRSKDDVFDPRSAAPIVIVRLERNLFVLGPPDELIRAGAYRILGDIGRLFARVGSRRVHRIAAQA